MSLIAYEKKVMPLCSFMCHAAREKGLVDVSITDHIIKNKTREVLCFIYLFCVFAITLDQIFFANEATNEMMFLLLVAGSFKKCLE